MSIYTMTSKAMSELRTRVAAERGIAWLHELHQVMWLAACRDDGTQVKLLDLYECEDRKMFRDDLDLAITYLDGVINGLNWHEHVPAKRTMYLVNFPYPGKAFRGLEKCAGTIEGAILLFAEREAAEQYVVGLPAVVWPVEVEVPDVGELLTPG